MTLPTSITINVTQENIQNGTPGSASDCAVALAAIDFIRNTISDTGCASVGGMTILIWGTDNEGEFFSKPYILPEAAESFIDRFDDGKEVSPITFTATERYPTV